MTVGRELISPILRTAFREFCVKCLVLRSIDDAFAAAGILRGQVPATRVVSGQRRTRVEEYYASINWRSSADIARFLLVLEFALAQPHQSDDDREELQALIEREGLVVDGYRIARKAAGPCASGSGRRPDASAIGELQQALLSIGALEPQGRGYAFERFLHGLFDAYGLSPRKPFRLVGEQLDGSFDLDGDPYLLEAKWHTGLTAVSDLLVFRGKVESKAAWGRGLFISWSGFSADGLTAFAQGRATNAVGMTGEDLHFILKGEITLPDAIRAKVRRAAETGKFYVSLFELLRS